MHRKIHLNFSFCLASLTVLENLIARKRTQPASMEDMWMSVAPTGRGWGGEACSAVCSDTPQGRDQAS